MARTVSLGAHRLPLAADAPREERLQRSREMLAHALSQGTTVAVVGSGCSMPLGYPSWRGFATELVDRCLEALDGTAPTAVADDQRQRLSQYQKRLHGTESVRSTELMFMIGVCKHLFEGHPPEENPYRLYLKERFRPPDPPPVVQHNALAALLQLPIERFVTTNYDCEIERALEAERNVPGEQFGIARDARGDAQTDSYLSFTQRPENSDQLALFALARVGEHLPDAKNMVFHCHGRFDDPDSIVATERDYQKWYLGEDSESASAFLQTFDLLFTSNPILFVGYGLGDEDLLVPLRRLGAATPERRQFRPLFALMPEASDGVDWDRHEQIFERYGLNVIPFVAPSSSEPKAWGRVLCRELNRLRQDQLTWYDAWLKKPMLRSVVVRTPTPQPYRHYSIEAKDHETFGRVRIERKLEQLKQEALAGARVIGLVGPGGTGKSWHAMRLLERMVRETRGFDGFFFWSSYYADDSLTGLDRLLGYIDPYGDRRVSRLKRLKECLAKNRFLVVLDGVERLLQATDDPEMGKSNDAITRRLLETFAESDNRSTLILTSRLWPRDLSPDAPGIHQHNLERLQTEDISSVEPFCRFEREWVSALCSLLAGHVYALFLAGRFIGQGTRPRVGERFLTLKRILAGAHPDQRLSIMMGEAVEAIDRGTDGLARALLERLAVFMSPIDEEAMRICFSLARASAKREDKAQPSMEQLVDQLLDSGLLFRITSGPSEREPPAFTVHPTLRTYVFQTAQEVERDVLPNFTLAGFTSSRAAVHPGSRAVAKQVRELFDLFYQRALAELQEGRTQAAAVLCRNLFGIVRSRMETNTVPRWTTYPEYIRFGLRLADLARRVSSDLWSFRERHELTEIERPEAPLYADEVAFVYNDIGLTMCAEGYMQDTLEIWKQGYDINSVIEGHAEVPLYSLQSQLHLGHTFLELGNLPVAAQYLELAARTNRLVNDGDYAGRIRGYQAMIDFQRGNLENADTKFEEALQALRDVGGNPRAESFFLNQRAKLAMVVENLGAAEDYLRTSHALAKYHRFEDLVAYARTARGRLRREQGATSEANAEFYAALAAARRLGIRRLEAEVLTGLCRVALGLGDTALARRRAMAALGIANELGLGLRLTLSLRLLGAATMRAGQRPLGSAYLRLAQRLGDAQEYWLDTREVAKYREELRREESGEKREGD